MPAAANTTISTTGDSQIKTGPGFLYWVTASSTHATLARAYILIDGTADFNTRVWLWSAGDAANNGSNPIHVEFDPPIKFEAGLFLDINSGSGMITVGWS